MIAFNAIHAEITWTLSDDGTLTISGTDMPNYNSISYPWYSQRGRIKKVDIKSGVTNIGNNAFAFCSSITSVTIGNSVISIGQDAFRECSSLTSITIPESVISIKRSAFNVCSILTSIYIPKSVRSIEEGAFSSCGNLNSVIVENGNLVYDSRDNCDAIIETKTNALILGCRNTIIPESVTSIENYAFSGCSGLTAITIPNSVTNIGNSAFSGCSGLTAITIPNSVTNIGDNAFYGCSGFTSITIPKSVRRIGSSAFRGCNNLTSLICKAAVPPNCAYECFSGVDMTLPLYVPANSINSYIETKPWNSFANILPISENSSLTLSLTDVHSDLTKGYYNKGKVTLSRNNMSVGDYTTFCLPFDIDISKTTDNFSKVYQPLNISFLKPSGTLLLLLDEISGSSIIKAGQTFVAKCKTKDVVFENCSDVTFDDSTPNPTPSNLKVYNFDGISGALTQNTDIKIKIGGTYSQLSNTDKNNYRTLSANGSFDSTTSVTSFQMYVYIDDSSLGSKVTSISFDFNDEATGIKELRMNNDKSSVYDLNGRMMNEKNLKPGLYIKNGKKIVIN